MVIINILLVVLLIFCTLMFVIFFKNDIKRQAEIELLTEKVKELQKKWEE